MNRSAILLRPARVAIGLCLTIALAAQPVDAAGTLHVWGDDLFGQVSDTPAEGHFTAVAAGSGHNLAIDTGGHLHAWGSDDPTFGWGRVPSHLQEQTFTAIAAGAWHNLALDADGVLHAWGEDIDAQVSGAPTEGTFIAVAAGLAHSIAVDADGALHAWGWNVAGVATVPDHLQELSFDAVAAGDGHNLALDSDGRLHAWGLNDAGQAEVPADLQERTITAIAAGGFHNLAIDDAGNLLAWGDDSLGQVGAAPTEGTFVAVAAGYEHSVAVDAAGYVHAWGADGSFWGADGGVSNAPLDEGFVAVAAGDFHNVAIQAADAEPVEVLIAVRPEDEAATLNLLAGGTLPVAILSTPEFDALDVDETSVLLADPTLLLEGGGVVAPTRSAVDDLTGNGLPDLLLFFSIPEIADVSAFDHESTQALLIGETFTGFEIIGHDHIQITGPPTDRGNGNRGNGNAATGNRGNGNR